RYAWRSPRSRASTNRECGGRTLSTGCGCFDRSWAIPWPLHDKGARLAAPPSAPLLDDAGDDAGAHRAAALADGEAKLLFHRDRHDQVHFHRDVVARHHHFRALRQVHDTGHVGGAEIELRTIVGEERGVTAALFLGEDVSLGLELGVRLHRA